MFCNKVSIELSELFRAAPSKLSGTKNNVHSLVRPIYLFFRVFRSFVVVLFCCCFTSVFVISSLLSPPSLPFVFVVVLLLYLLSPLFFLLLLFLFSLCLSFPIFVIFVHKAQARDDKGTGVGCGS